MIVTALLLWLGFGHRSGKVAHLGRAAALGERASGLPGWAALPSGVATVSLITAVFGMYWDISLHIDVGRDPGPLANPAHYFILIGLFGIFSAGFVAMVLPQEDIGPTSVRITKDWHAPLGGVLVCACGAFSLLGFPLDDMWHRLFGQDVTLWGPTHLMLIGGAAMTLIGLAVLLVEGIRFNGRYGTRDKRAVVGRRHPPRGAHRRPDARAVDLPGRVRLRRAAVPLRLPADADHARRRRRPRARPRLGRAAAPRSAPSGSSCSSAAAWPCSIGPILGEATPHFPLYIVEALIVEAVGLRRRPRAAAEARAARRAWASAPSASRPSGAGRTSSCRCRGRRRCSPRARCWASRWRSPAR